MDCQLCGCMRFEPNQWRRSLCKNCHHGFSSHDSTVDAATQPRWYFARVEGPFTWEQMRHWLQAGYFATDKLLVRDARSARDFKPFRDVYPSEESAFLPAGLQVRADDTIVSPSRGATSPTRASATAAGAAAAAGAGAGESASSSDGEGAGAGAAGTEAPSPYAVEAAYAKFQKQSKELIGWVEAYFGAGTHWYFLDQEGAVQGPFTADTMVAWYKAGYFLNENMLICHHGWDNYVPLSSILGAKEEFNGVSLTPSQQAQSADQPNAYSDPLDLTEVAIGIDGAEGEYDDNGYDENAQGGDEDDEPRQPEAEDENEEQYAGEADAPLDSDNIPVWLFADEAGDTQGPFTAQQMQEWLRWDYFSAESLVRHAACKQFCAICELFPDLSAAFAGDDWIDRYNSMYDE